MSDRRTFTYDDIITIDDGSRIDNSVNIKLIIGTKPHVLCLPKVWLLKNFIFFLGVVIRSKES